MVVMAIAAYFAVFEGSAVSEDLSEENCSAGIHRYM